MEGLRQYALSVICVAFVSGILISILPGGGLRDLVKLLCGLFLTLTVVGPLSGLELDAILACSFPDGAEADRMTMAGVDMANQSAAGIIKAQCESYILDKAEALSAEVGVEITVGNAPVPTPTAAVISGKISADVKRKLETILQNDLGIPKECVRWTG